MEQVFKDYIIAEHRIRIKGDTLVSLVNHIQGFNSFIASSQGTPMAAFTIKEEESPNMENMEYTFDFEGIKSMFGTHKNGYIFEMKPKDEKPIKLWSETGTKTLYITWQPKEDATTTRLMRFILWIAFGMCTTHLQTIAIHASTITYKERNILFLGESGTGKSTHTRLWKEYIKGTALLNDDSPILRIIDGKPWVFGSPWSGKTPCYKNEKYPLAACVRLSQAPYNKIEKLNTLQAFAAIHPSCPPEFAYDENLYDGISQTLNDLLSQVPFYHLECLPDAAAVKLSFTTIFGSEPNTVTEYVCKDNVQDMKQPPNQQ